MLASIFYIVVLIGVLVFVHEYGHYLAARWFKVKVLSFSVGFGPRMFGFKRGETDWVIRWLPLGGYVQMLGADPLQQIPEEEKEVSFQHKPLWQRSIIILAGPLANLLLPIPILFFVLLGSYDQDLPPTVGQVLEDTPSEGKLQRGDEIIAIDGDEVQYWRQLVDKVEDAAGEPLEFTVLRDGEEVTLTITPRAQLDRDLYGLADQEKGKIGIAPTEYRPLVGITDPDGPAARAGLQNFDEIVSVDGKPIEFYTQLEQTIARSDKESLELVVLRGRASPIDYGQLSVLEPLELTLKLERNEGQKPYTGFDSAAMFISQVDPGSPADEAGLQPGDQILAMNGREYNHFDSLTRDMANHWDEPHELKIRRSGEELTVTIQPEKVTVVGEYKEEQPVVLAGFYHLRRRVTPPLRDVAFGDRLSYAGRESIAMTAAASTLLVRALYGMVEGKVSTKSLGGPIMIGHMASKAGEAGPEFFLRIMAMISINLGIINLLPIPVLDGGHLLLFAIEGIKRGPLSMRTRQIASFVGLAIIVFLMLFAFKNDIERYWSTLFG